MRNHCLILLFTLLSAKISFAQSALDPTLNPYFELVRPAYSGDQAYKTVAYMEKYWRVAGNTGFNNTVYLIAEELEEAGFVLEEKADANARFTYRIEKRAMNRPTWEPVDARVEIIGENEPLLEMASNLNMTYLNSYSTPKEGIRAELIYVANRSELNSTDVEGKILFSDQLSYGSLQSAVAERGALGVFTYDLPKYLQPEKNQTSIQFRSLRHVAGEDNWAIALSYQAKERLKSALSEGKVEVKVAIETKIYDSEELTVVANIKGATKPLESLVFSAHIQEPGANDNASGVGAQLEMATVTARLMQSQQLDLDRTLTFLWGDEIISTHRYVQEKDKQQGEIKWGISLDMVGENTSLTGGTFLIEKMPDPSAIWTRGKDKHSEWGGSPMRKEDMTPHYLNDFILTVFQNQGRYADWVVETNPFEGGSDHTPFLNADIPGLLLWHFTDQFYHTDNDRLDKVSQETLKNVATGALVSAYTLLNADEKTAKYMAEMTLEAAKARLQTEFDLSKAVIAKGGKENLEKDILETWRDYYLASLDKIEDIQHIEDINPAKEKLIEIAARLLERL